MVLKKDDQKIFYLTDKSLAETFNLTITDFLNIVEKLINSSDPTFKIKEYIHFIIQGKSKGQNVINFSREGAIAVAKYFDEQHKLDNCSYHQVLALIEDYRINKIDRKITFIIYENSSSLIRLKQRHWLNFDDVSKIFQTTKFRLQKAFEDIEEMKLEEDFIEYQEQLYFSLSGLYKISLELSLSLRSQERREYCDRVREIAPPVVKFLAITPSPSGKEINSAISYLKNKYHYCQITGKIPNRDNKIDLAGHHLYDKNVYNFLADDHDNIIIIDQEIHKDFHQWNGGNLQSCRIDDFIEYIELKYPSKHELLLMLHYRRSILLLKLSKFQRFLPEGM